MKTSFLIMLNSTDQHTILFLHYYGAPLLLDMYFFVRKDLAIPNAIAI